MSSKAPMLSEARGRVLVRLRVQPRSKRTEIVGIAPGADVLQVRLKAAPVEGAANAALCRFLGRKVLKVAPSSLEIVAGRTSRNKVVAVTGLSLEDVRARLLA